MRVISIFLVLGSLISCATVQPQQRFLVESVIEIDGKVVASPGLLVLSGKPASVREEGVFELDLVATDNGNAILLNTEFRDGERRALHEISVTSGREIQLELGTATITLVAKRVGSDA